MSLKKVSKEQPNKFEFTDVNLNLANKIVLNYPADKKKSAVMALLYLAQNQNNNWIPLALSLIHISEPTRQAGTSANM